MLYAIKINFPALVSCFKPWQLNRMFAVRSNLAMSLEEYLATEPASEVKREFVNGEVIAMAGARYRHNKIVSNLVVGLGLQMRGGPCAPLGSDQRVLIEETGLYAYPDLTILCGPPLFVPGVQPETLLNPTCIIEVLSDATESWDRGAKSAHYRRRESLRELWLVASDRAAVEQYRRDADGRWFVRDLIGWDAAVEPTFVDPPLSLAEIYRGVPSVDPEAVEAGLTGSSHQGD